MGCTSSIKLPHHIISYSDFKNFRLLTDMSHPQNINQKYLHLMKLQPGTFTGESSLKTLAYHFLGTKEDFQAARKQFWAKTTQKDQFQRDVWNRLRLLVQKKETAPVQELLNHHKIYMYNNQVQFCVDRSVNKYQLPVFVINSPLSFSDGKKYAHRQSFERKTIEVSIKSNKLSQNITTITQFNTTQVLLVKQTFRVLNNLDQNEKVKFIYNGKQIKSYHNLANIGYEEGKNIQVITY